MQQHRQVAELLRNLVRRDRYRGQDPEPHVGQEGGGDQHAVEAIVDAVTDQHDPGGRALAVVAGRHLVALAILGVAVAPEHEFLEHEEERDAAEHGGADRLDAPGPDAGHGLGQQPDQRRRQHGAGREADQVRQQATALRFWQQQEQARQRGAQQATEQRREQDPGKRGHGSTYSSTRTRRYRGERQTSAAMRPVRPSRR